MLNVETITRPVAKGLRASPMVVTQCVLSALNNMCDAEKTTYRPVAMGLRATKVGVLPVLIEIAHVKMERSVATV